MIGKKPFISVVVPAFNEEQVIIETHRRLTEALTSMAITYEIIVVNDGSTDGTLPLLTSLCKEDARIKAVSLSRNFGQMASISAGLKYAGGDAVVIIDSDLQDPPQLIRKMIEKWREGYDVVYGKRIKRNDETLFKKLASKLFFRVLKKLTDVEVPLDSGDFRLIDKKVRDCLLEFPERNRFMRGLISWVGFRQFGLEYVREGRIGGKTKYSPRKLAKLALCGFTSMTHKPMRIPAYVGLTAFFLCLSGIIFYLVTGSAQHVDLGSVVLLLLINLLFSNFALIMLGLKGEYLGLAYEEMKGRPLYIINGTIGFKRAIKNQMHK